jgi:hypothetical protein
MVFAAIALVLAAAYAAPSVREAVGEAGRVIQRILLGPPWVGYYIESARDPAGSPIQRVMFAAGSLPGTPTVPEVVSRNAAHGQWSPDGERAIVRSGSKIYLGDRSGRVRVIADVGVDLMLQRASWVGADVIVGVADGADGRAWIVRVRVATGEVSRRAIPVPLVGTVAPFSPDGRWLPVATGTGPCGEATALYDVANERIAGLSGAGSSTFALDWLRDGSLVRVACDPVARKLDIHVGAPETALGPPTATVAWDPRGTFPVVDRGRDRILIFSPAGSDPTIVSALSPSGGITELARIPRFTTEDPSTEIFFVGLSRDARYLSVRVFEARSGQRVQRIGVIDLASGRATYGCDVDCVRLTLR